MWRCTFHLHLGISQYNELFFSRAFQHRISKRNFKAIYSFDAYYFASSPREGMNTTKVFMTISPGILLDQEMILKGTVSNAAATSAAFPGIAQNSLLGLSNTFYYS